MHRSQWSFCLSWVILPVGVLTYVETRETVKLLLYKIHFYIFILVSITHCIVEHDPGCFIPLHNAGVDGTSNLWHLETVCSVLAGCRQVNTRNDTSLSVLSFSRALMYSISSPLFKHCWSKKPEKSQSQRTAIYPDNCIWNNRVCRNVGYAHTI